MVQVQQAESQAHPEESQVIKAEEGQELGKQASQPEIVPKETDTSAITIPEGGAQNSAVKVIDEEVTNEDQGQEAQQAAAKEDKNGHQEQESARVKSSPEEILKVPEEKPEVKE